MDKTLLLIIGLFVPFLVQSQSTQEVDVKDKSEEILIERGVSTKEVETLMWDYELLRTQDFSQGIKIIRSSSLKSMEEIAEEVKLLLPESFSSEYIQFKENGFTEVGLNHLRIAESKTENKTELYTDFMATAHILGKTDLLEEYALKLRNSGFINSVVLEYNKNVLRSLKENKAMVVTNGWEDTYPLLSLLKEEKKKNTTIVNVEWIYDANFRKKIATQLGTDNPAFTNDPYIWINAVTASSNIPVYYTPTLPNSELIKLQNELVPIGLLFKRGLMTSEEQKSSSLKAWKKFSKLNLASTNPISKNYIILLTLLEQQLSLDVSEKGTLDQIREYKAELVSKHPSLK